jgi:hypothetical protein
MFFDDVVFLGCDAVWTRRLIPPFRRNILSPKRWYLPMSPHGVITQKNIIDIFTAMKISNLKYVLIYLTI